MNTYKKRLIYTLAVTAIIVFSSTYAVLMTLERTDYRNYLQAQYSKSMYELLDDIENIQDSLGKTAVSSTKEQNILIFEDIYRYSSAANDKLNSLPVDPNVSTNIGKFINQVGDYCYSLIRNYDNTKELTDNDYKTLDQLEEESDKLKISLNNVLSDINQGKVKWGEIREKVNGIIGEKKNLLSTQFSSIEKEVLQYPSLIYDGPFSDNILEIKPRVNQLDVVTQQETRKTVANVIGTSRISKIELVESKGQTRIAAYSYNVYIRGRKNKNKISCEISKHGGKVIYLLDDRQLLNPKISEKQAEQNAKLFLKKLGYKDMKSSYSLKYEDNVVINFVHNVNNVFIYPEQVEVKVALDDGNIVGFEAEKYLVAYNQNRKIVKPKLSLQAARNSLNKRFSVKNSGIAIIPTEMNKEILCYEFYGNHKKDEYIVYVNANTGKTERILKVINTPNGRLTI
ncbi:germination protein YpeB [Clostridium oryzae]|uniref:Sporulation protein YpeB n=1 Tax=Clostridium oryzae TaxID=1450648 RepID=A0A1V4IUE2_9CLOT|nr:germination protein YpeB [Clostridium oryzae]OPJ63405.1 sporulation protein YpeB [Clostridium oryzae]